MANLLEVAVDSLASARAAIAGGADRLELCSALTVGGLTPYAELLKRIRAESNINIRCLMRPRSGDFLYTKEEILMMAAQIKNLQALGSDGFVIGCLYLHSVRVVLLNLSTNEKLSFIDKFRKPSAPALPRKARAD